MQFRLSRGALRAALAVATVLSVLSGCQDPAAPRSVIAQIPPSPNLESASDSPLAPLGSPGTGLQGMIAFSSDRSGSWDIYMLDVANGRTHRLTRDKEADNSPTWSPDGKKIAFGSQRDGTASIYAMTVAGGDIVRVTSGGGWHADPAWSPNGMKIAYTDGGGLGGADISVMNADGTGSPLNLTSNAAYDYDPSWSPDGTKIAFASNRDGQSGPNGQDIYVMNANGTGVTRLTLGGGSQPAWSPDGLEIAFASVRDGNWQVYVVNASGIGSPANLTKNAAFGDLGPSWSSDGTKIAFSSNRDGKRDIYVMNADGTGAMRVARNSGGDNRPAWRP